MPVKGDVEWFVHQTASGGLPFTLDEAKEHLKLPVTTPSDPDVDAEVNRKIRAATLALENKMHRSVQIVRTLVYSTAAIFEGQLTLSYPPLIGVTDFTYYDAENNAQTLAEGTDFSVIQSDIKSARIQLMVDTPILFSRLDAVQVTYQAGYATADDVPEDIKEAVKLVMDIIYDNDLEQAEAAALWDTVHRMVAIHDPGIYR